MLTSLGKNKRTDQDREECRVGYSWLRRPRLLTYFPHCPFAGTSPILVAYKTGQAGRAKPHFPSKQVTNDQDCVGCIHALEVVTIGTTTILYTVELIEVSHREVVGFRAP